MRGLIEFQRLMKEAFGNTGIAVFAIVSAILIVYGVPSYLDMMTTVYGFFNEYLWGLFAFILTFILAFWIGGILLTASIFIALTIVAAVDAIFAKFN